MCSSAYSQIPIELREVRKEAGDDSLRIIAELSSPFEYTRGRLSNPERLYIDIKNARISKGFKNNASEPDTFVRGVRIGQYNSHTVRIVMDIQKGDYKFDISCHQSPSRLVVDFFSSAKKNNYQPTPKAPNTLNTEESPLKRKIVIDPGHGGHDPGAVGYKGLYEKNVVLDIALKVRDIMKQENPFYEVILTRDSDVFIPLHKRAEIANRVNADMFVSIHTNASYNRMAQGIETYILNWTDDEEAMKVAARENGISLKEMKQLRDELSIILASLESESKRDESIKVAGFMQRALISSVLSEHVSDYDRGVKQALFYVLVGAKMPAALVEVGFISNIFEEKMLGNETYRLNIAKSIVAGIKSYFSETPVKSVLAQDFEPFSKKNNALPARYIKK
jgi:N-acetylmuramoyl-L-alanine amidase